MCEALITIGLIILCGVGAVVYAALYVGSRAENQMEEWIRKNRKELEKHRKEQDEQEESK